MSKRSSCNAPGYEARMAARRRLRAIVGWGVRFKDLSPQQRQDAERRASEALGKASLDDIARGLAPRPTPPESVLKPALPLRFEARFRAALMKGDKTSTIRKRSSHTARYALGRPVQIEAPKGQVLGLSAIVAVDENPRLSPAERQALQRIYGPRCNGPWVRLRFAPIAG